MRRFTTFFCLIIVMMSNNLLANEPDSAFIVGFSKQEGRSRGGLQYVWSIDKENWYKIGDNYKFVYSDFGSWGGQKKMHDPYLFKDDTGKWHCVWKLNDGVTQFAHAASDDLAFWWRQSYPYVMEKGNCEKPEISFDDKANKYKITWYNKFDNKKEFYKTYTSDFKEYTTTEICSEEDRINNRQKVVIDNQEFEAVVHQVEWDAIDHLIKEMQVASYKNDIHNERAEDDPIRFKNLKPLEATLKLNPNKSKSISDLLIGIFFEDINYAADGGLYAELVQNRGFEYNKNINRNWQPLSYWHIVGNEKQVAIETADPLHENNPHYVKLAIDSIGSGIINEGFDGIPLKEGELFDFSMFVKGLNGTKGKVLIQMIDEDGTIVGKSTIKSIPSSWKKLTTTIKANKTVSKAKLKVTPLMNGELAMDMISLFPRNTFKGHKNGLRADLAQVIADMNPRFVRFPGGCVAHGNGIDNIYRWKNTIGPLEARVPMRNIWRYQQSMGLGYFEYFQFCEDIGAEPLPVLAAGVPCQNSSIDGHGQQGGIPMCDMGDYVQEVLDLIEWANGDKNTKWGRIRAEAGHPEPFNLKYLGIGNEDLITDIFEKRFTMIYNAVREKYPDIKIVGTVGPFYEGTDYEEGWKIGSKLGVDLLDEHYYVPPGWFIYNQDYYDKYDRNKPKVYLGEYASHLPNRASNIETALSEALYLTALERNGDIVEMTSYAPLLAKERRTQWTPDLIYFNNTEVKPTVDYYVQMLYGQNTGDKYIPGDFDLKNNDPKVKNRLAYSVVKDSRSNSLIVKLVNMLPVEVNTAIDLSTFSFNDQNAKCTILSGDPKDREAKPVSNEIAVSKDFEYSIPKYSFTVINIQLND